MPHFLDRLPNGRCRAWWMAHGACPGNQNPHDWATEHVGRFLAKAAKLDVDRGMVPGCRAAGMGARDAVKKPLPEPVMKSVRKRSRARK